MGHVGVQIDDNFFICPTNREELKETGTFNHSCEPNLGMGGVNKYVAIRDIKKGEELVDEFVFTESSSFEPFKCNCSSKNCRKVITQNDWKLKNLQDKYFDYFSPSLFIP